MSECGPLKRVLRYAQNTLLGQGAVLVYSAILQAHHVGADVAGYQQALLPQQQADVARAVARRVDDFQPPRQGQHLAVRQWLVHGQGLVGGAGVLNKKQVHQQVDQAGRAGGAGPFGYALGYQRRV